MVGNVEEFYKNIKLHFGTPKFPSSVTVEALAKMNDDEKQRVNREQAENEKLFLHDFKTDFGGFSDRVYTLAAQKLRTDPDAKRSFPPNGVIHAACEAVHQQLAAADCKPLAATKPDPWAPERIKQADRMMNSDIGRLAASEGWIVHLHDFCREQSRLPSHLESERVRGQGLRIKAEREEMAARGGATNRIVLAVAKAMEAKRKKLSSLAYGKDAA